LIVEFAMKWFAPMLLVFVLCFVHGAGASVENAEIYNRANALYTNKEYFEALELYRELENRGVQNPALYYNLANTYFKLGMKGFAVLYFERALLLKPFDRDIRANLTHVQTQLEDRIRPLYDEGMFRFLRILISFMILKTTVYLESALFGILIMLLLIFLFLPHARQRLRRVLIVIGVLYAVVLSVMISQYAYRKRYPQGIVLQKALDIKSSPLTGSDVLFTLHEGTKFKLIERRGEWIRLSIADGRQGWIDQEGVELIGKGKIM
jgi:tetratricopeptide (TPR) repeat protein